MDLLVACVRRFLPHPAAHAGLSSALHSINWHHLLWLARIHRSLLFLQAAFAHSEPGQCPPQAQAQLRQLLEMHQLRAIERAREHCLLHDLFARANLPALAMSGWIFGQRHHPTSGLREVGEGTAFLVAPSERNRAQSLLEEAGYVFDRSPLRLRQGGGRSRVVFHTRLCETDEPWTNDRIQAHAEPFAIAGRTLTILRPEDWIRRIVARGGADLWWSLLRRFDFSAIVSRHSHLDWEQIVRNARSTGTETPLLLGLGVCHESLGLNLPAEFHRALRSKPKLARHAKALGRALNDAHFPERHFLHLRTRLALQPTLQAKLRLLGRFAGAKVRRGSLPEPDSELPYIGRFSPTPRPAVRAMLLLAGIKADDVVYDLGCGDGRVVIAAAKQFSARGVGIDIDPERIASAQAAAAAATVLDRVTLTCADVMRSPLHDATIVCLYLQGFAYPALRRKLQRECGPGTRLVSHNFIFPGWPPEKMEIVRTSLLATSHLYLWRL